MSKLHSWPAAARLMYCKNALCFMDDALIFVLAKTYKYYIFFFKVDIRFVLLLLSSEVLIFVVHLFQLNQLIVYRFVTDRFVTRIARYM